MTAKKATYAVVKVKGDNTPTAIISGFSSPEHAAHWVGSSTYGYARNMRGVIAIEVETLPASELKASLEKQLAKKAEREAEQERLTAERVARAEAERKQQFIAEEAERLRREADLKQIKEWQRIAAEQFEEQQKAGAK